MKTELDRRDLIVKRSPIHGYGVFTNQAIPADAIIEECCVLTRRQQDAEFRNYYFGVDKFDMLVLGFGSLYNHRQEPNAYYEYDPQTSLMIFRANRLINANEEIFISYGKDWFSDRKTKPKETTLLFKLQGALQLVWRFTLVLGALSGVMLFMKG